MNLEKDKHIREIVSMRMQTLLLEPQFQRSTLLHHHPLRSQDQSVCKVDHFAVKYSKN